MTDRQDNNAGGEDGTDDALGRDGGQGSAAGAGPRAGGSPERAPSTRRPRRRLRGADRGPQPLAAGLDAVVQGLAPPARPAPSAATWGTVFSRWDDVVGPGVARHAHPLRLEAGVLVVAVDQPPWATQVRTLGPRILATIADLTGEPLERMEVVVRR